MEITGERFDPSWVGFTAAEHYHRYLWASQLASGRDVLDMASGEGYGSRILAEKARSVVGLDISPAAVAHAGEKYQAPNLRFQVGDAASIPLASESADLVTSFETLEHLNRQEEMISEIARVLRPDGVLLISTPNRLLYDAAIHNEFHVRELDLDEFRGLLARHFRNIAFVAQRVMYGSLISGRKEGAELLAWDEDSKSASRHPFAHWAMYHIAIASNGDLPVTDTSFLEYPERLCDTAWKLAADLENVRAHRDRLAEAQRQLLQSHSWRWTRPLREGRKWLARFVPFLARKG